MKYRELEVAVEGRTFLFVTRGRSKPFTMEEALQYIQLWKQQGVSVQPEELYAESVDSPQDLPTWDEEEQEKPQSDWHIPDDKMRRAIFHRDLSEGLKFCMKKYGQTAEAIKEEARRLALGRILKDG